MDKNPIFSHITHQKIFDCGEKTLDYIIYLYSKSIDKIKNAFDESISHPKSLDLSNPDARYPFVGLCVDRRDLCFDPSLSYGVVFEPGSYGTTLTRPDLFKDYYIEQLSLLIKRHKVPLIAGLSSSYIPLSYVVEHTTEQLDDDQLWTVKNGFVLPNLTRINDDISNGTDSSSLIRPLSLFNGERVDYSLHRLHHYTGTSCEHFQGFILLTNYQRYIDEFIEYSKKLLLEDELYTSLVGPGNQELTKNSILDAQSSQNLSSSKFLPQMPAYHLKRQDKQGITFINIGVGPSNAKNITDHLAVLRPHCWIMLGHCAGLRSTQTLGDYVLAHGYVREDHVLDQDLPPWIPVPPIAEVQVALQEAIKVIMGEQNTKKGVRTGTVCTTDNRNWELRSRDSFERFRQSRAIAVDMESATVAANGFRFRVPYGTLLCVSDKPIQGEVKLKGMANAFYRSRVSQHLEIGLETIRLLREAGVDQLHSRKLRGFDEPPFR